MEFEFMVEAATYTDSIPEPGFMSLAGIGLAAVSGRLRRARPFAR